MPRSTLLPALRIALIYLVIAGLWIVLSDQVMDVLIHDHASYVLMQTWKGWIFVAVTAVMLYSLVRSAMRRLRAEMLEQQQLATELATSRSIQARTLEALDDVVWMRDLRSGNYLFISRAVEQVYGVSAQTFLNNGQYWIDCVVAEDREIATGKQAELKARGRVEVEYRIARPGGDVCWLRDRTRVLAGDDGEPAWLIGIATDISLQRQHAERIHHLSNYDTLTGLPNRAMLDGVLHAALDVARRDGRHAAVLYLDLARLKDINDTFGHAIGDDVLRSFSERLRNCLESDDTVARLGADEFAAVLPRLTDAAQAGVVAQRMLAALAAPVSLDAGEVRIGASIGISVFPDDGEAPEALLQHASLALQDAKSKGRSQMSFYQPSMNAAVSERVALMGELHHALERGELELHYQPQVELASGHIVGMEALMRWRHPKRGLVSPAQFIPLAEESGLILTMGVWALEEACRQNRAWQDAGLRPLVMAVNVSARQFNVGLHDIAARALAAAQLAPAWLELEVTESVIMEGAENVLKVVDRLRGLGVQLSIDDFGTGYSSLSYLTRFAVNKLKIDQAFVRGALQNERDAAIVGIIVQMAKTLQLRVVAEGVETEAQADMLRQHGCDDAQGYFYARPQPAADITALLQRAQTAA
ncbi:MAG: EAL domain-containing protein [Rhodocyclaceae bacterium]|nr:EAL domain-containing protein [Rhodocyclaceae bacterium]